MLNASRIGVALRTSRTALTTQRSTFKTLNMSANKGLHTSSVAKKETPEHTIDTYAKEVDSTPVEDTTVHRVDPDSDVVQKPHEAPSGYSRAGVQYEEYRVVEGKNEPYSIEGGSKGNYGGRPNWVEDRSSESTRSDEGPNEKSSGGRS